MSGWAGTHAYRYHRNPAWALIALREIVEQLRPKYVTHRLIAAVVWERLGR